MEQIEGISWPDSGFLIKSELSKRGFVFQELSFELNCPCTHEALLPNCGSVKERDGEVSYKQGGRKKKWALANPGSAI